MGKLVNKLLLVTVLFGQTLSVCAQGPRSHPLAVGIEGAAYRWASSPAQPRFQALSGAFFRYVPERLGVRVRAAFNRRTEGANTGNCADCLGGETAYRTFTLRIGGQYTALPKVPWLYGFLDVAYRKTSANGRYTGGFCGCLDYTGTQTKHSLGAMVGVGASFQIIPRVFLGPELYYEGFVGRTASLTTDNRSGQQTAHGERSTEHAPAIRVQAALTF